MGFSGTDGCCGPVLAALCPLLSLPAAEVGDKSVVMMGLTYANHVCRA